MTDSQNPAPLDPHTILSPELRDALGTALLEFFIEEDRTLADVLSASLEEQYAELLSTITDIDDAYAFSATGRDWRLLLPLGADRYLVVGYDTEPILTTLDAFKRDPQNRLGRDGGVFGKDYFWEEDFPFWFEAEVWEGVTADEIFGDGNNDLLINGETRRFPVSEVVFRYRDELPAPPAGDWFEYIQGGTSMTSGDIGFTITVDSRGRQFSYAWGCYYYFDGRLPADATIHDALAMSAFDFSMVSGVARISSEVCTPEQFVDVVKRLVEASAGYRDDDPDEVEISCPGFDGTLTEFREQYSKD